MILAQITDASMSSLVNYGALGVMCLFFMAISFKAVSMLGVFLQTLLTEFLRLTHEDNAKLRDSMSKDSAELNDTVRGLIHQVAGQRIATLADILERGRKDPTCVSPAMMKFADAEIAKAHAAYAPK